MNTEFNKLWRSTVREGETATFLFEQWAQPCSPRTANTGITGCSGSLQIGQGLLEHQGSVAACVQTYTFTKLDGHSFYIQGGGEGRTMPKSPCWNSTVTEKTIPKVRTRKCCKHDVCVASSQWKHSSSSFLFSTPASPGDPCVWNKHLQWFHQELTGTGKRSISSNAFKNALNLSVRPSQPTEVKVMFTCGLRAWSSKRTGISHRELLPYHKGPSNHKITHPRYLRHAEIMFHTVPLLI